MGDPNAALVPQNLRGTEAATFAQLSQILRYPRICGALRRRGSPARLGAGGAGVPSPYSYLMICMVVPTFSTGTSACST